MWSLEQLKEKLHAISLYEQSFKNDPDEAVEKLTEAAVLVPIVVRLDIPCVLLTVRAMRLSTYPGQVAFPGGKRDPEDSSLVETALREADEEIGLKKSHVKVIGSLLPFVTAKGIHVTPIVGIVVNFEDFHPKLNPLEVCEMFIVPLEHFIKREFHKCKPFAYEGKIVAVDFFEFSQNGSVHIIWGLTAVISTFVAMLLFGCLPEFEYQWQMFRYGRNYNTRNVYYGLIKSKL